jgi:vacuolar-type H+-ATPase subunit H
MQRTLVLAQRTADAAVREAREEADSIVSSARREAATVLTNGRQEADRYAAESRLQIASEVRELEDRRDALYADLDVLEKHVDAERAHLRTAVEELQRIVSDPDAFRVDRPAGVEEPAPQAAAEPLPMPMPEPPPEPVAQPEPQAQPEPLPAPPFPADPEPVRAAETAPVEVVNTASDEDRGFAPSAMRAPEPEAPQSVPSAFGPPPGDRGGAVQTMPSPPVAAPVETEPGNPSGPGNQLIDLTHEREMPVSQEEDAFLAELRKAMTDDEPLGPREDQPGVMRTIGEVPIGRQRGRFGRRR